MRENWTFEKASLNIGHKTLQVVDVRIVVCTKEDDEYAEEDKTEYIDGVRIEGELAVDVPFGHTAIAKSKAGVLRVSWDGEATAFNVLFVEQLGSVVVIPHKVRRCLWLFYGIGRPLYDAIGLFPPTYGKPTLKVFVVRGFVGYWTTGTAALIVAHDRREARRLLDAELAAKGLADKQHSHYDLAEVDLTQPKAAVICDGG